MYTSKRNFVFVLLSMLSTLCISPTSVLANSQDIPLTVSLEKHRNVSDQSSPLPLPGNYEVAFTPLPRNSLWGSPIDELETVFQIRANKTFVIDPDKLENTARTTIEMTVISRRNDGITISNECRFLRYGTFVNASNDSDPLNQTGIVDRRTGDFLLFTYFNRPCRITGTDQFSGESFHYDVDVENAGFNWISIVARTEKEFDVYRASPGVVPTLIFDSENTAEETK